MTEMFEQGIPGRFLYSRHANPSNAHLAAMLAAMESTEAALVAASGMGAISCALMQLCESEDEIIASRTVYGGTYALMDNLLPRYGVRTHFVDINDLASLENAVNDRTKVVFAETMSNPLLAVANLRQIRNFCDRHKLTMVIDNTFAPLVVTPADHGADIVIHSLTKYINGMGDHLGGAVCGRADFVASMMDVNSGTAMLLGPAMDALVSSTIRKNLQTLPVRVRQHSANAMAVAKSLAEAGFSVVYPGLASHPDHTQLAAISNPGYGAGGVLTLDCGSRETADILMQRLQGQGLGYLAVSLGFVHTLFSMPACSTSSEIPTEERERMGLSTGFVRMSIGIDADGAALAAAITEEALRTLPAEIRKAS
jgi:methionine-gamma-lyase